MRIPLTKYGWPQVALFPAVILALMGLCLLLSTGVLSLLVTLFIEAALLVLLLWSLAFFRDPARLSPTDKNLLLAPADGRVTDIETVNENHFIAQPAVRIGIFLSILDVHINRAPCNVTVQKIQHKQGKYKNAMNPSSGRVNESVDLELVRTDSPRDKLIVRQISGAIARRIVCHAHEGEELTGGQTFGMIKFGSRTELFYPLREKAKCLIQAGDKVKAGLTPLVRYEM